MNFSPFKQLALALSALALTAVAPTFAAGTAPPAGLSAKARPIPLIEAVRAGRLDRVRRLIEANADVNVARLNGFTALHMAARTGNEEAARLLIQAGADINAAAMGNGVTPLYVAAETGHLAVARALLAAGAAIGQPAMAVAVADGRRRLLETFLRHGADVQRRDGGGETYLHLAVLSGRVAIVNLLIRYGAQVNAKDANGLTPLGLALGDAAMTAALRGAGADDVRQPDWKTLVATGDMAAARGDDKSATAKYELARADLAGRPHDTNRPWRLVVLEKLAHVYARDGHPEKARRAASEFIRDYRQGPEVGAADLAKVTTLRGRLALQRGDLAGAEKDFRAAAETYEDQAPRDPQSLAGAYLRLANTLMRRHLYEQAQRVFEKTRKVLERDKHADPVVMAMTEQNLAHALRFQGKLDRAAALYRHSNALLDRSPDADPGMAASGVYGLAVIARRRGRLREAADLYKRAIDAFEQAHSLSPSALKTVKLEYRHLRDRLTDAKR